MEFFAKNSYYLRIKTSFNKIYKAGYSLTLF